MKGGFSFCGVDIADIGLEYVPDNKDAYVYAPAKSEIHEQIFEGHNGGYYFGSSKQPKEFHLKCFYEDKHVLKGIMAQAFSLFAMGNSGTLIFKNRPWCYYYATVVETNIEEMYNYMNGIFSVTLKAYYPFAKGLPVNNHLFFNLLTDNYHYEIMENTALLDKEYMVPDTVFESVPSNTILLYNPGTERAKVDIILSGNSGDEGIVITNRTTEQSCKYIAFNLQSGTIHTDGINGKTTATKDGIERLAFLYHDYGFIELEPAFPIVRGLYISNVGKIITSTNILYNQEPEKEWYKDKYIFIGNDDTGSWYKIKQCTDKHTLELYTTPQEDCSCKTNVVLMNEIVITPSSNTSLSNLSFIYEPTFA